MSRFQSFLGPNFLQVPIFSRSLFFPDPYYYRSLFFQGLIFQVLIFPDPNFSRSLFFPGPYFFRSLFFPGPSRSLFFHLIIFPGLYLSRVLFFQVPMLPGPHFPGFFLTHLSMLTACCIPSSLYFQFVIFPGPYVPIALCIRGSQSYISRSLCSHYVTQKIKIKHYDPGSKSLYTAVIVSDCNLV